MCGHTDGNEKRRDTYGCFTFFINICNEDCMPLYNNNTIRPCTVAKSIYLNNYILGANTVSVFSIQSTTLTRKVYYIGL